MTERYTAVMTLSLPVQFVVACNRSFGAAVPAGAPSTSLPAEVMVQSLSLDVLITGGVVDLSSLVGHFQYNVGGTGSMMQANVSTLFKPLSVSSQCSPLSGSWGDNSWSPGWDGNIWTERFCITDRDNGCRDP